MPVIPGAGKFCLQHVPLPLWLTLSELIIVIAAAVLWFVRQLMPERFRIGRSGRVLKEVLEIEGRV